MAKDNEHLVVAFFANELAARQAAEVLMTWDKEKDELDLGAVGIMTLNEKGEMVVKEIGDRNTGRGALWGTAIGAGLGLLTGGIALIPGMLAGATVGAGVGAMDHKSLGLSDEDLHEIATQLRDGSAAVGVMCDDFEMDLTLDKLVDLGGSASNYALDAAAMGAIATRAAAERAAETAVEAALQQDEAHLADVHRLVVVEVDDQDESVTLNVATLVAITGLEADGAARLHEAGAVTAARLLALGATPEGRAALADAAGVDEQVILQAVQKLDLMRIDGVGVVYANLLFAASIESVPDLAQRDAISVQRALARANQAEQITDKVPGVEHVQAWIDEAKTMPRVVVY